MIAFWRHTHTHNDSCHSLWITTYLFQQINAAKSTLSPTEKIQFIEACLSSTRDTASLPKDRFQKIVALVNTLQSSPQATAHKCLQLLGHMAACNFVASNACLHMRCLQGWLGQIYKPNIHLLSKSLILPVLVKKSLQRWTSPQNLCSRVPFHLSEPFVSRMTDAFLTGCSAYLWHHMSQGLWFSSDNNPTYQHLKTRCSQTRLCDIPSIRCQQSCETVYRQYCSNVLYESSGRGLILTTLHRSHSTLELVPQI